MERREFGKALLMGAAGLGAAGLGATPVLAQAMRAGNMQMGPAERRHAVDTLGIGSVALLSSRMALGRARRPLVRQFADFEVEENTTVAQIIGELSGLTPPPPNPADRRLLDRLAAARGPAFDRDYLLGQIDGHQRQLRVQERYLSEGRNTHHRHIAMLARGRIREHLRELQLLQTIRG